MAERVPGAGLLATSREAGVVQWWCPCGAAGAVRRRAVAEVGRDVVEDHRWEARVKNVARGGRDCDGADLTVAMPASSLLDGSMRSRRGG